MTAFSMDEASAQLLKDAAKYADANRIPLEEMMRRHAAHQTGQYVAEPDEEATVILPFGFKVVITVEQHPLRDREGGAWLRHMSMSSPRSGRAPIDLALAWVMGQVGFTTPLEGCMVYPENIGPDHIAINVLEEIKTTEMAGTA